MSRDARDYELCDMAGAYGPMNRIPLLDDLLGSTLVHLITFGYAMYAQGYTGGIFQNDGKIFPQDSNDEVLRTDVRNMYCQTIRSTPEGYRRCKACDCQAIHDFAGGNHVNLPDDVREIVDKCRVQVIEYYAEQGVYCYMCHAGLVELIRELSLQFTDGGMVRVPVGAMWAGQHKLKGQTFTRDQVVSLAMDIGYDNPGKLVEYYDAISPVVDERELQRRAEQLDDIAIRLSESVRLSFAHVVQLGFHRINQEVLGVLRLPLRGIEEKPPTALRHHMRESLCDTVRAVVKQVNHCMSVMCLVPSDWESSEAVQINIVAHDHTEGFKGPQCDHFFVSPDDLGHVLRLFPDHSKPVYLHTTVPDLTFFVKLHGAAAVAAPHLTIINHIVPVRAELGILLWVLFLERDCQLVLGDYEIYPEAVEMFERISENIQQIRNVVDLVVELKIALNNIEERTEQLENGKKQRDILVSNMAHQVSRPIMELKGAAYILSQEFAKEKLSRSQLKVRWPLQGESYALLSFLATSCCSS